MAAGDFGQLVTRRQQLSLRRLLFVGGLIDAPVRDEALQRLASLGFGQPPSKSEGNSA